MNTQELRNKIDSILGNSMRVLLPSYWWKRLFHHVADALDSKGQGVSIVESEKDLKKLDVPEGSIASVVGDAEWKSFDECYQPPEGAEDEYLPLCTRIPVVNVSDAPITIVGSPLILLADISNISANVIKLMYLGIDNKGVFAVILSNAGSQQIEGIYALRSADSTVVNKAALNQLNSVLASGRFLFIGYEADISDTETEEEQIAALKSIFSWAESIGGVFRKGANWDRLAMANEIPNIGGSTGGSTNITVDSSVSTTSTNPVQNKAITQYVNDLTMSVGNSRYNYMNPTDIHLNVGKGYIVDSSNQAMPAGDVVITSLNGASSYRDRILVFFGATSLTIPSDVLWENGVVPTIDPDATYVLNIKSNEGTGGTPIHMASLKAFSAKELISLPDTEMSDTSENPVQNKVIKKYVDDKIAEIPVVTVDSELSDISENPAQNKVIKAYVDTEVAKKVDKVSGKGLSTEDFTTVLKTKLEGLENYDDTTLTNAINSLETRLNTLVSGDTSTAIESFNEVVAFLENLTDTQDLSSIIASIEQQINTKQAKINDLEDIRSGASLGKTSLQEHQDISHLATKKELNDLTEEVITNEDIASAAFAELSSRIDSQVASLKRTTSQNLISQVENLRSSLTEIIIDDEDVVAAALAEQSQRIDSKTDRLERVKATRDELAVQVESILSTILENEDIISAALAEINGRIEHIEEVLKKKLNRVNYEIS